MAKKTSGPPPFMDELCKLLGVKDNTKTEAGPDAAPKKVELKFNDVEPKAHKLKATWTVDPKISFGPHEGIYAEPPLEEENQKILDQLAVYGESPIAKVLEANSLKDIGDFAADFIKEELGKSGSFSKSIGLVKNVELQSVKPDGVAHMLGPQSTGIEPMFIPGKHKLVYQVHDELVFEAVAEQGKEEAVAKCSICGASACAHLGAPQVGITKAHPAVKAFKLLAKKLKFLKAYSGGPAAEEVIKSQMQMLAEKYLPIGAAHQLVEQAEKELVAQAQAQPNMLAGGLEAAFQEMEKWQGAELAEPAPKGPFNDLFFIKETKV